jgi:predicted enzyme related to lactoylglutathione lyase
MAEPPTTTAPALHLQLRPMVHVPDIAAAVAFYEMFGGSIIHGSPDSDWVLMQVGTAQIGLLARPPRTEHGERSVELNFFCPMPLDELQRLLHASGSTVARMSTDRTFGRQLHVKTPDGMLIKINHVEPDLLV